MCIQVYCPIYTPTPPSTPATPPLYNIGYEHIRYAPFILGPVLSVLGRTHSVVTISPIFIVDMYVYSLQNIRLNAIQYYVVSKVECHLCTSKIRKYTA